MVFLLSALASSFEGLVVERTYWYEPRVSDTRHWVLVQDKRPTGLGAGPACLVGLSDDPDTAPQTRCEPSSGPYTQERVDRVLARRAKRAVRITPAERLSSDRRVPKGLWRPRALRDLGRGRLVEVTEAVVLRTGEAPSHYLASLTWLVDDAGSWTSMAPYAHSVRRGSPCAQDCSGVGFVDRALPETSDGSLPLLASVEGRLPSEWTPFVEELRAELLEGEPVEPASLVARQGPAPADRTACLLVVNVGADGAQGAVGFYFPPDAPPGWTALEVWKMASYTSVVVEVTLDEYAFLLEGTGAGQAVSFSSARLEGTPCPGYRATARPRASFPMQRADPSAPAGPPQRQRSLEVWLGEGPTRLVSTRKWDRGFARLRGAAPAVSSACPRPTSVGDLLKALDRVEEALRDDGSSLEQLGDALEHATTCSEEVVPWPIRGPILRAIGATRDGAERAAWWSAARSLDSRWEYGEGDVPARVLEAWRREETTTWDHLPLAVRLARK